MNRRELIYGAGLFAGTAVGVNAMGTTRDSSAPDDVHQEALSLADYEPKSMLREAESHVSRSRYPVIDTHTHITYSAKSISDLSLSADRVYLAKPEELLSVMDRKNILAMVNLTGGYAQGLKFPWPAAAPGRAGPARGRS